MEKLVSLIIIAFFALGLSSVGMASETDLKKRQEEIEQQIQQVQQDLQQKKIEESKALQELRKLNNTLSSIEKKLRTTEKNLSTTEKNLRELESELQKSENNLAAKTQALSNRLNTIYEQGNVHILEVLLSSTSFTDFLTRWDLVSRLAEQDMALIDDVKAEIGKYREKRQQVLVKKESLFKLLNDQNEQRQELKMASSRQSEIYRDIASERKEIEAALDDLEQESARIALELSKLDSNAAYMGTGVFAWPTPGYKQITSPFGWRRHPILKSNRFHTGVDIGAPYGAAIVAADHGRVIEVGWRGAYGRVVMINHGGGIVTMYAHTSASLVDAGDFVKKGQAIARVGTTGWSTGPHLHFEVRKNGEPQNPTGYIK
jgi:murein DD-endopeptidase MepM/ murein hydrolase activator NlpD